MKEVLVAVAAAAAMIYVSNNVEAVGKLLKKQA